jgi:molybdopterin-containing oxidoreductase family membrane subunit
MISYLRFWYRAIRLIVVGTRGYYAWMGALALLSALGALFYAQQVQHGFIMTSMGDHVSWGAYISNFTFLVGVAASAVMLVVPSYVYHRTDVKRVVLLAEILAFSAILMAILFIAVDLGHPERFIHLVPGFGHLNVPRSMLSWDVVVITGYLVLNMHVPGYLLYKLYKKEEPSRGYYLPFVFISIGWAVSIHTVTAFLFSGFGSRPYWNTAVLAPRFLVSAMASGPAILIPVLAAIERFSTLEIAPTVYDYLRKTVIYVLPVNFFLLGCELFKEFYTGTTHVASAQYLFFGLHGHHILTPYIWVAISVEVIAFIILRTQRLYERRSWLFGACVATTFGIWVEKGMGLIIPGFVPSPLGEIVDFLTGDLSEQAEASA